MIEELSQETVTEYANNALTIQEPQGTDYTQGVKVGKTIPAKWWNWLFNAVTKRLGQSKTDAQGMLSELQNTVTDAGIELDPSDNTQLTQAIVAKTDIQIGKYIERVKKNYLLKWYNADFTFDTSSATYNFIQNVLSVNGLYIGRNYGTGNCYYSKDFRQWQSIRNNNSVYNYISSCVYFEAAWYMTAYSSNGLSSISYFKSADGTAFQSVTLAETGYYNIYGGHFFIANDTLYLLAIGYLQGGGFTNLLYWTTDGSTWQNRVITELPTGHTSSIITMDYMYHCPVKLAENKYVLGAAIFDTTTHMFTQTTAPVLNNMFDYLKYNAFRMPNGQIFTCDAGRQTSQELIKINSDGTFSTVSGTYQYTGNVLLKGTEIKITSSITRILYNEFSVDGDTFMSLPTEVLAPMQRTHTGIIDCIPYKGKWLVGLITGLSTEGYSYVRRMLYIADNLSSDPSDYRVIRPPEEAFEYMKKTNLMANDNAITFGGKVSFDDGQTWQDGTIEGNTGNEASLYSSIPKEVNGNFYGTYITEGAFGGIEALHYGKIIDTSINYKLAETINMVIGHTLYLR